MPDNPALYLGFATLYIITHALRSAARNQERQTMPALTLNKHQQREINTTLARLPILGILSQDKTHCYNKTPNLERLPCLLHLSTIP